MALIIAIIIAVIIVVIIAIIIATIIVATIVIIIVTIILLLRFAIAIIYGSERCGIFNEISYIISYYILSRYDIGGRLY